MHLHPGRVSGPQTLNRIRCRLVWPGRCWLPCRVCWFERRSHDSLDSPHLVARDINTSLHGGWQFQLNPTGAARRACFPVPRPSPDTKAHGVDSYCAHPGLLVSRAPGRGECCEAKTLLRRCRPLWKLWNWQRTTRSAHLAALLTSSASRAWQPWRLGNPQVTTPSPPNGNTGTIRLSSKPYSRHTV